MPSSAAKVTYTIRSLQGILAAAIIGLAAALVSDQAPGKNAALQYGLAVGAISLVGAFVGVLALWAPILQGLILLLTDVVVLCVNLAGGLVCLLLRFIPFTFSDTSS